jgi:hypothetical protein
MTPCGSWPAGDGIVESGARLDDQSLAGLLPQVRRCSSDVEWALSKFCAKGFKTRAVLGLAR